MDASTLDIKESRPGLKVSISARLVPALSYAIPAIGGAISSFFLMSAMRALRQQETSGLASIMKGIAESTIPVLASLYLAAICGVIVIGVLAVRMLDQTKTASPAGWFFVVSGLLCLLPAGLFCEAESIIIEILTDPVNSTGIAAAASNISWLLTASLAAAPIIIILLMAASVLPLSSRSSPKWGPIIAATTIEVLIIFAAIAFQMRLFWLYQAVTA